MRRQVLLTIVATVLLASPLRAADVIVPEPIRAATSTMPDFLPIVLKHQQELKITKDQLATIAKWRAENKDKYSVLTWKVRFGEKAANEQSLMGVDHETVTRGVAKTLKYRQKIAQLKTQCRDMVRNTLSARQWKAAVKLLRQQRAAS